MFLLVKIIVVVIMVVLITSIAHKRPLIAGLVAVLPFVSALSLIFIFVEGYSMGAINQFAVSAICAMPLSMSFFIPFVANRWLKLPFISSLVLGFVCLAVSYGLAYALIKK